MVFSVERGGERLDIELRVTDLNATLAREFVCLGGATIQPLTLHCALRRSHAVEGVWLVSAGYMFDSIPEDSVLVALNNIPTPTLDAFVEAALSIPDRKRIPLRYYSLSDLHVKRTYVVRMDRTWFPFLRFVRDDASGLWRSSVLPPGPPPEREPPVSTRPTSSNLPAPIASAMAALCEVRMRASHMLDGLSSSYAWTTGTGVIVDAAQGLVLVCRATVPSALGDVVLHFFGSVEVDAEVVFVHPIHNYSFVRYDPRALGDTPVCSAVLDDPEARPSVSDPLDFVGFSTDSTPIHLETSVMRVHRSSFPDPDPPRYRPWNEYIFTIDRDAQAWGGVLLRHGTSVVTAFAVSFTSKDKDHEDFRFYGLAVECFIEAVRQFRAGVAVPRLFSLEVELTATPVSVARSAHSLPEHWVRVVEDLAPDRHVLAFGRAIRGSDANPMEGPMPIRDGDLILAVNGRSVAHVTDFERLVQEFSRPDDGASRDPSVVSRFDGVEQARLATSEPLPITVFREGAELVVPVRAHELPAIATQMLVLWNGLYLQETHRSVALRGFLPDPRGVFVTRWTYGSPAQKYGLRSSVWITELNGTPIHGLASFLDAAKALGSQRDVRLRTVSLAGRPRAVTMRTDPVYFPMSVLRRDPATGRWVFHRSEQGGKWM